MKLNQAIVCGFLALALSMPAFAAGMNCSDKSAFPEVSGDELQKLVEKKEALVIDVNSEESYKSAHVPGAIHYGSNQANFAQMLPKEKNALIVAYCGGPGCGAWTKAAQAACEAGYTNIRHYKGGIQEWKKRGQKG